MGIDKYIIRDHPFHLSNHSCEPNCGLTRNLEYITLRDINKGEELCWDYSTSMLERHWEMQCECGSQVCRHLIQDFDLLPFNTQEKYLLMKIVLPLLQKRCMVCPQLKELLAIKYLQDKTDILYILNIFHKPELILRIFLHNFFIFSNFRKSRIV